MLPLSTDSPIRRTPWVNYGLITINALLLAATRGSGPDQPIAEWAVSLELHTEEPALHQFLTYQFLHADLAHLVGNMLFLWVFGNSVNGTFGNIAYLFFYLAGGVMAALGFTVETSAPASLVGASGAVAAVTTAYLALFPRSHVRLLYWFFLIGFIELRAVLIIVFKIVLWDNVLMPQLSGPGNIAYSAHLAGYAYGFATTMVLLLLRALPRDQFDAVALIKRWYQRQVFADTMRDPNAQATAQFGRVARPISLAQAEEAQQEQLEKAAEIRGQIASALAAGDPSRAARQYLELLALDDKQVLPRRQQLDVANQFYAEGRYPEAAAGYERFLRYYSSAPDASEVRLLLGIIYARDLEQFEAAERHLQDVKGRLTDDRRIRQHQEWLSIVLAHLGRPTAES